MVWPPGSGWFENFYNLGMFLVPLGIIFINIITTIHILLYKKNTRAAVGWVGLVWFSPGPGALLYLLFGINRIHRRARKLFHEQEWEQSNPDHHSVSEGQLKKQLEGGEHSHLFTLNRMSESLSQRPLTAGNAIDSLLSGEVAYEAMIESIHGATQSITLSTYIFDRDRAGLRFGEALVEARQRGVEIRVLIDDVGSKYSFPRMIGWLKKRGILCDTFMRSWIPWHVRYYNLRNHRKILVVDGETGFTGGMNIREGYVSEDAKASVQDIHFRLRGPIVRHLQQVFAEDWFFTRGERLRGSKWFPSLPRKGEILARGIPDGPDEDYDRLRHTFFGAVSCAEQSVRIMTPYFLPDEDLATALKVTAMRGIDVTVLVPEVSNLRMVQWASEGHFEDLVNHGVSIYRAPPPFDHSKLMIVDGVWVNFGSANWDPRSLKLNFEFNVECYSEPLAETLTDWFDRKRENASIVRPDEIRNWNILTRLRNHSFRLLSPYL